MNPCGALKRLYSFQTWVAVWSHEGGRLWRCAATCLNDAPSPTRYKRLNALNPLQLATCSGPSLMVQSTQKFTKSVIAISVVYFISCWHDIEINLIQMHIFVVLPPSKYLQFDCGVTVQLGFAAEFSNIMVIYTRILDQPKEIVSCSAQLTDFPLVCWLILLM